MEKKNNNGIIIFLICIVIILLTLCVLLATGKINFKSNNSSNVIQNVDEETLNKVLPIIGANSHNGENDCTFLSQHFIGRTALGRIDSYEIDDAYGLVLGYYKDNYSPSSLGVENCMNPGDTVPGAECFAFSKNILNDIIKKYDLPYTVNEIFADYFGREDKNNYYLWVASYGHCAGYDKYKQNISSWYGDRYQRNDNVVDKSSLTVRDELIFDYGDGDKTTRVVYYTFKLTDDNNYKLWLYEIK